MGLFIIIMTIMAAGVTGYETDPQVKEFVDTKVEVVKAEVIETSEEIKAISTPVDYSKMND